MAKQYPSSLLKSNILDFSHMIFSLLRHLSKNEKILQKFLELLNRNILTKMNSHLLLTDILSNLFMKAVNPTISILALSSLFILMRKYGIDQPNYYDHLYRMLQIHRNRLFLSKHSTKLKKLLEISLRSSKVSLKIVCSFIKLLLRVCFECESSVTVWIVAFILNLFIK